MSTVLILFFIGYVFHCLYKLMDIGFIFLAKFVRKFKKDDLPDLKVNS